MKLKNNTHEKRRISVFQKAFLGLVLLTLLNAPSLLAQNIGINNSGNAPDASAMLDIVSDARGLLIPRVALTAINSSLPITSAPVNSLFVYNTATAGSPPNDVSPGFYWWYIDHWVPLGNKASDDWKIEGNDNITYGTHFLGTTNNVVLAFRTNNQERMSIKSFAGSEAEVTIGQAAGSTAGNALDITATSANNGRGIKVSSSVLTSGYGMELDLTTLTSGRGISINTPALLTGRSLYINAPLLTTGNVMYVDGRSPDSTSNIINLFTQYMANEKSGVLLTANSIGKDGRGMTITNTDNVKTNSHLLHVETAGSAVTANSVNYNFFSTMSTTGGTRNVAGYFYAQGATNNHAIIVPVGANDQQGGNNVGIGILNPAAKYKVVMQSACSESGAATLVVSQTGNTSVATYTSYGIQVSKTGSNSAGISTGIDVTNTSASTQNIMVEAHGQLSDGQSTCTSNTGFASTVQNATNENAAYKANVQGSYGTTFGMLINNNATGVGANYLIQAQKTNTTANMTNSSTNYGIWSEINITNANSSSNYAGYFIAKATGTGTVKNVALTVPEASGNVGFGTTQPDVNSLVHIRYIPTGTNSIALNIDRSISTYGPTGTLGQIGYGVHATQNWQGPVKNVAGYFSAYGALGPTGVNYAIIVPPYEESGGVPLQGGYVGIGNSSPTNLFCVGTTGTTGSAAPFQVNSEGNMVKINTVTYSWPATGPTGNRYLQSDASGNLTWVPPASGGITSISFSTGLTGPTNPITATGSISFDYSATLALNPALAAGQGVFGATGIIFEGNTADNFEGFITSNDPTADRTWAFPDVSGTVCMGVTGTAGYAAYYSGTNTISSEQYLALSRGGTNTGATATTGAVAYGTGTAYAFTAVGTTGYPLLSGGSGAPAFGKLDLGAGGVTGILPVSLGGTSFGSYTIGDLLYASGASVFTKLAIGTTGYTLISSGTGPSWGQLDLVTGVTGVLPLDHGGTSANLTANAGGVVYSAAGAMAIGPTGTTGYVLTSGGTGAPTWTTANGLYEVRVIKATGVTGVTGTTSLPSGVSRISFVLLGGGGGAGGVTGAAGGTGYNGIYAGGGGAGAYNMTTVIIGTTGPTGFFYSVGGGGVGGNSGNNGAIGGTSYITYNGESYPAPGGNGGTGAIGVTGAPPYGAYTILGGAGGAAGTTGDIKIAGQSGGPGMRLGYKDATTAAGVGLGGNGASSQYGAGGQGKSAGAGVAGGGYGAGGAGGATGITGTLSGGNGAPGVLIMYIYK